MLSDERNWYMNINDLVHLQLAIFHRNVDQDPLTDNNCEGFDVEHHYLA